MPHFLMVFFCSPWSHLYKSGIIICNFQWRAEIFSFFVYMSWMNFFSEKIIRPIQYNKVPIKSLKFYIKMRNRRWQSNRYSEREKGLLFYFVSAILKFTKWLTYTYFTWEFTTIIFYVLCHCIILKQQSSTCSPYSRTL